MLVVLLALSLALNVTLVGVAVLTWRTVPSNARTMIFAMWRAARKAERA